MKLQHLGVLDFAFPLQTPETASAGDDTGSDFRIASALGPTLAQWITSHRDLPLRLNQYTSAFSRESSTGPFLRSYQYLVQEAYSAHLTQDDTCEERDQVLDIYSALYRELLAVPVVKGYRSASNDEPKTNILLGYLPTLNQWIEAGAYRELGRAISREYDITVWAPPFLSSEKTDENPIHVRQNTWTLTTSSIGLMILTHADDRGLVIPPRIAPTQVLLLPKTLSPLRLAVEDRQILLDEIDTIRATLARRGIRVVADLRDVYSHAWKWNEGLVKGVPVAISFGMDELRDRVATLYRRDREEEEYGWKVQVGIRDLETEVPRLLGEVQDELFRRADKRFSLNSRQVEIWDDFAPGFCAEQADRNGFGGCLAPHCLDDGCGSEVETLVAGAGQEALAASTPSVKRVCIPWDQPEGTEGKKCINPNCTSPAKKWAMFGCK